MSTFEFKQLVSELGSCQLMDAVRRGVLVVQRLVAGVHDGGAIQQSNVTNTVGKEKQSIKTIQSKYE